MNSKAFAELLAEAQRDDDYWEEASKLDFAMSVHQLMKNRGIKRSEFAERLGVRRSYVTKVLRGDANLTISSMVKVLRALGASLNLHATDDHQAERWVKVIKGGIASHKTERWQAPSHLQRLTTLTVAENGDAKERPAA